VTVRGLVGLALLAAGSGLAATLSLDPAVLTLPTGAFHYDPLVTVRDLKGQAVWADLPAEVQAVSSNPQVATVNERVRICTTGKPGKADISLHCVADSSVQTSLQLTTVDATIEQVWVDGPSDFPLYAGQALAIEGTALLSNGELIPHVQYSSDLDILRGSQYATVVDGLGIVALQPSPPNTPISIGFVQGGGTAAGTISVRKMEIKGVQLFLGGKGSPDNVFKIPGGYQANLEVVGTYEDGTSRPLTLNQDYSVALSGDPGFRLGAPGFLTQPLEGQWARLSIDIHDSPVDISAQVFTVDGSRSTNLSVEFANYPDDRRLLYGGQGYAREVRVLADFPGLPRYRVSGRDPLVVNASVVAQGCSRSGWPTLRPARWPGSGDVRLRLGGTSATLPAVSVVTPRRLSVAAVGKRAVERLPMELGTHLSLRTLVDYGDGHPLTRSADYPVGESPGQPWPGGAGSGTLTFFLNVPKEYVFWARDAEENELPATLHVNVNRQSDPSSW